MYQLNQNYINNINIQLTNANGQSVLLADVKNTTSVATKMMLVSESTQFSTSIQIDYANAYDFKITKNKK